MSTINLLNSHRSIRKYKHTPVSQSVLNRIIEAGGRASNTGNMQLYSVIVTREPDRLAALSKLHYGQGATAPLFLTICADVNRYHHWCRLSGCDEPYGNLLWFVSALVDASLCAQNICIAAEEKGLGFCYLGTVNYNTRQIADLLQCPKGVVPVIAIAMGYPNEEPRMSERLGQDAIVHNEVYHDPTDDDIIRTHRVRDEHPFNRQMVEENGTRNYCEIFTTKRYPRGMNVAVSNDLLQFLRDSGMWDF